MSRLSRRRRDLAPSQPPPFPLSDNELDRRNMDRQNKKRHLADRRGGGGWEGAQSYDGEEAWSSINH